MIKNIKIFTLIGLLMASSVPVAAQTEYSSSAQNDIVEQTVSAFKNESGPVLILSDNDLISWEASTENKYIYFEISDQKNEELAHLTAEHLGEPLKVTIGNVMVQIPEINDVLDQKSGFVLRVNKSQRQEFSMMLDRNKMKKAETDISVPIIVETMPEPVPTNEPPKEASGAPESIATDQ